MISIGGRKKSKKAEAERKVVSMPWQEKKQLVQKEEEELRKDIEELTTWVDMIETMNDQQLKGYLQNHHGDSKMTTGQKIKSKIQGVGKSKSSTNGIMASVWKFHKK